ncbi:helix-turn-helix domain-containing protein [Streptococcus equinus]|uniref:helix-turn-helix domain-containing protein n=1 Tax=Streptococcus equinus TaxID=1335 RepID=UPI001FB359C0|nr:Rgg/GadR/MutR family transcriptional regulator [Streptococcus equinus]UOC12044.1 helix-turn-helix domain-containing protein [Streptococcus equinus]
MDFNFGKTLKKIRKGKQVSISSLADNYLSKSQISRFERGESEITCSRLVNLLNKLNISVEEFLIIHNNDCDKEKDFVDLVNYVRKSYSLQHYKEIKDLLLSSSYRLKNIEKTMLKSIIYSFDCTICPTQNELKELTDYLFKVENWGYYEIILLGNCIRTIEYSAFYLLTKEMLENFIYSSLNKTNKKLVAQLAINCLIASIDLKNYENCQYLITKIESLLRNELNYYEQTVFLYVLGYYEFMKNKKIGKQKMLQALQVFLILNEKNMYKQYKEHYTEITNDTSF